MKRTFIHFTDPRVFARVDEAERALSSVESSAIPLIRRIEQGDWRLTGDERESLSLFIALQSTRGPDARAKHELFISELERHGRTMSTPQEVKEFAESYEYANYPEFDAELVWRNLQDPDFSFAQDMKLQHLQNTFVSAERDVPYLMCRRWIFLYFDNASLLTSDTPVTVFSYKEMNRSDLTLENGPSVVFPISRKVGLLMGKRLHRIPSVSGISKMREHFRLAKRISDGEFDETDRGVPEIAQVMNAITLHTAHRYVFRHPDDSELNPDRLPAPTLVK